MLNLFIVAIGGACGSAARYAVTTFCRASFGASFPWGTLIVNLAGSFAIGLLTASLLSKLGNNESLKLLLIAGFLGGFTTFSAFSLDAVDLLNKGATTQAAAYVLSSVGLAITATFLGLAIGRALL